MLTDILSNIICTQYESAFRLGFSSPEGMLLDFKTSYIDVKNVDYPLHSELLLANINSGRYTAVFTRDCWNYIGINREWSSTTDWECLGFHDSEWRTVVRQFLFEHREHLTTLSARSHSEWYQRKQFTNKEIQMFRELVKAGMQA